MIIKKNSKIVARKIHGSYFLVDISDNYSGDRCSIYEINETGMFIWNHIDDAGDIEGLTAALNNALITPVDHNLLRKDITEFVSVLESKNFVEV